MLEGKDDGVEALKVDRQGHAHGTHSAMEEKQISVVEYASPEPQCQERYTQKRQKADIKQSFTRM